ncbi:hypothetical protein Tco_1464462 [Tanacetum coccineum]
MGDSSEKLNFTAEQLEFFLETCIDEVNRLGKYHLWANLKGKTGNVYNSATNSFNFTEEEWKELNVKTKNKANNLRNSPLLYPDLYVPPINEGGSLVPPPTNENHDADFDTGYDNDFEGGVSEFEEDMKQAIVNLAKGGFSKNKGPLADECHEKLKILELESNDPLYLAAFLIFSQPGGNYRDTWMTLPSDPNVLKGYIQMVAKQLSLI